eukprot:CAMPEP_0206217562 /NCGR_PEP_ID=MMETSP0047_2-20121206/3340_1 /ASSEMBLY_ACC=CAM_ASM_000192 /TAXON_ID=195065 /ORGANISM="Chroomonas mesostigmatica_cf, Strain CCMP1168" /LENGTH=225 /DNA_ID=CAMNT_0053640023 /DNA_START=173 /DNA_END=847 /DNA_ORIENTATION=-
MCAAALDRPIEPLPLYVEVNLETHDVGVAVLQLPQDVLHHGNVHAPILNVLKRPRVHLHTGRVEWRVPVLGRSDEWTFLKEERPGASERRYMNDVSGFFESVRENWCSAVEFLSFLRNHMPPSTMLLSLYWYPRCALPREQYVWSFDRCFTMTSWDRHAREMIQGVPHEAHARTRDEHLADVAVDLVGEALAQCLYIRIRVLLIRTRQQEIRIWKHVGQRILYNS